MLSRIGVPGAPKMAQYSEEEDGILVKWEKGTDGDSSIQGYVIEGLGGSGMPPSLSSYSLLSHVMHVIINRS